MSDEWVQVIRRLVDAEGGNQSRTARLIGVDPQRVGSWLKGGGVEMEHLRKVARVTNHSLPYLMAAAYGIPLEEMADGVGADVLPHDHQIVSRKLRRHISDQYVALKRTPPEDENDADPLSTAPSQ
jgi:transcriptional regulator with XRE-family HTH domain